MTIGIELTVPISAETAEELGFDEDSIIEAFYEDECIHIRKLDPKILADLERAECEGCEFYCPTCDRCTAED